MRYFVQLGDYRVTTYVSKMVAWISTNIHPFQGRMRSVELQHKLMVF